MAKTRKKSVFGLILAILWVLLSTPLCAQNSQLISTKSLRSMARAYLSFGKYDKAAAAAQKALQQAQEQHAETGELALCMIDLGTVYSYEGQLKEAQVKFEKGIELQKQALFAEHPYVAHTLRMLSDVCRRQGDLEKAETVLSEAVQIMLKNCDLQSKEMAPFVAETAHLQFAKGELDKAQSNYVLALDLMESTYGTNHLVTANLKENYAKLLMARHEYATADELLSSALTVKTRIFGRYDLTLVDNWLTKAYLCQVQGKTEQCEYYLAKSTASAAESRNVITMARIYDKVNKIRAGGLFALANL
ncbi:MAG: tetratricopeptide repeat protein [Planctomycetaceae bacterium]|nr:tetratricopeptide repeat protein [Planctomycetaceae bacterium]